LPAYALLSCKVLVIAVFVAALVAKRPGRAFARFTRSTGRLLPRRLVGWQRPVASAVFAAEATTAVAIAVPATGTVGLALAAVVLLGFTAAIVAALRRGETGSCNCFGASTARLGPEHVARNLVLVAVALAGVVLSSGTHLVDAGELQLGGIVIAVIAALCGATVMTRFDEIIELFRPSEIFTET
jgi:hypothetical protein